MSLLSPAQFDALVKATLEANLLRTGAREQLLALLPPALTAMMPTDPVPMFQARGDLAFLNGIPRLADGTVPLVRWLENAATLAQMLPQGAVFRSLLDLLGASTSGQILPPDPATLPEVKEAILFGESNLLPFSFLAGGARAGQAVAHLAVPKYENGKPAKLSSGEPVLFNGTAWLLTPELAITNHHVIQARESGEPEASQAEMSLQAAKARLRFDFNTGELAGVFATPKNLEASSKTLDYAIVRLAQPASRQPIRLADKPVKLGDASVAVNIIQHPDGGPKQICVRNNRAVSATETDLYYLTDTKFGSSGSPVMNDAWNAVALHRGSRAAEGIAFQGPRPAFFNVGTPIHAILKDLKTRHSNLFDEIAAAQTGT